MEKKTPQKNNIPTVNNIPTALMGMGSAIVAFTIVIGISPIIMSSMNTSVVSANIFTGATSLITLIPLVLVGAVIIGIVMAVTRLSL